MLSMTIRLHLAQEITDCCLRGYMSDYCENDEKSALGSKKISSLMLTLAVPSVIAYVIIVLYNIVDRIYIGHIHD